MPLPSDEKIVQLARDLLGQLDAMFGLHPGFRAAHARGVMLSGTLTPSRGAVSLSRAPHITRDSTPVTVRFSNGSGLPLIPDNAPDANRLFRSVVCRTRQGPRQAHHSGTREEGGAPTRARQFDERPDSPLPEVEGKRMMGHWEGNLNLRRTVQRSSVPGNNSGVITAMEHLRTAGQPRATQKIQKRGVKPCNSD